MGVIDPYGLMIDGVKSAKDASYMKENLQRCLERVN